jgi:hypothetical protein
MVLKRYIMAVTALILLFSLLTSFASGVPGSAEDPVASLSYIQGTFVPKVLDYLESKLLSMTSQNEANADLKISSVIGEAEKALTIDSEKLKERVAYNTYMEMLDRGFYIDSGDSSLITLKAGQRIVVIRGSSFAVLQGSAIIGGRDQESVVQRNFNNVFSKCHPLLK